MLLQLSTLLVTLCVVRATKPEPEVKAPAGTFRGKVLTSHSGNDYASYRGIPYALPPTGDRRFALPERQPAIETIYDAGDFGSVCVQHKRGSTTGKEDCLYLNVFTPLSDQERTDAGLKKVFVFIHGAGLIVGSSNPYVPGDLVTRGDLIVVTINYRLGWLGFLRGNSSSLPGNQAYWDQLMALQWVQDNIIHFGGDPSDVTLSGESGGSTITTVLSLSPLSEGLFSKAILLSGTALIFSFPARESNDLLQEAAEKFRCGVDSVTGNEEAVVACLKQLPANNFVKDYDTTIIWTCTSSGDDLLPRPLRELLSDQDYLTEIGFYDRDLVVSVTADDGYIEMNSIFGQMNTSTFDSSVRDLSNLLRLPEQVTISVLLEYQKLYGELEKSAIAVVTDEVFLKKSLDFLNFYRNRPEQVENSTKSQSYLMSFDHAPRYVPHRYMLHALDLVYLFDLTPKDLVELFYFLTVEDVFYDDDVELRTDFIDLAASFIKTGNPGEQLSKQKNVTWLPYDLDKKSYLSFSLQPSVGEDIFSVKRIIWDTLVPQWLQEYKLAGGLEKK